MKEAAKKCWHDGFAPFMSTEGLQALRDALERDDVRLIQGATTEPPPCVPAWPCEGACAVSYAGWQGDRLENIEEVTAFFAAACWECGKTMGDQAACRYFLNWYDETPRAEMVREFLPEVEISLISRLEEGLSGSVQ